MCIRDRRYTIQNPLLDDVNLSGANGILVNITAGPDFTMAEFDEVGRTIEGFAAEDATVVLGTVLDPDMQDEVRVTVVATGLNRTAAVRQPLGRGESNSLREPMRAPIKLVRDATTGMAYDANAMICLLYTSPSPRDLSTSRMPSSA